MSQGGQAPCTPSGSLRIPLGGENNTGATQTMLPAKPIQSEVPYIATRTSWSTPVDDISPVLIETFVQETRGLASEDIEVWRLGVKFNAARQQEMMGKLRAVVEEYMRLPADDDGVATSLLIAHRRDPGAD